MPPLVASLLETVPPPRFNPMARSHELDQIRPNLAIWQAYDSALKADLFSTALATQDGVFIVDPIELDDGPLDRLLACTTLKGIVVTNRNHVRSAHVYARKFPVTLFAHRHTLLREPKSNFIAVADGETIRSQLEVTTIDGAARGEIALYHAADGGTLIVGDALINFDPYGFALLPGKYCEDPKQLRKSLRKLLRYNAERMLFAHGVPILSGAHTRLRQLLDLDP